MEARPQSIVVDTNVLVAAAFKAGSDSARVLEAVRQGRLRLIWNDETRRESERIVRKIPPLSWSALEDLFRQDNRHTGPTDPDAFLFVPDPEDRKFAALAAAAGATLVTSDQHLLGVRAETDLPILTPGELCRRIDSEALPDGRPIP